VLEQCAFFGKKAGFVSYIAFPLASPTPLPPSPACLFPSSSRRSCLGFVHETVHEIKKEDELLLGSDFLGDVTD
jgi:hypothetical protein